MNIRQALTENAGAKLIALVVAMFIWFNASGQQTVVQIRTVPISLENVPDSLVVTGSYAKEVEVSLTATKRRLLTMGFKRVRLVVDMAEGASGRQRVSLTPAQLDLPGGVDRRNVRIVSPTAIDVTLEPLVTERLQVVLETRGEVPDDLVLLDGALSVFPSWTSVRGPRTAVAGVSRISTEPLDLGRIRESGERELRLEYDRDRLTANPDRVTASIRVSAKGERVLPNVPPTVLVDSEDLVAQVFPNTVTLTLEGPTSVLDTLSSGDVSVLLNLSGRGEAQYKVAPEVILPSGVVLSEMSVDSLIVRIFRSQVPQPR